jgi:DNA-directed RNA polymerase specialized sigma subunit
MFDYLTDRLNPVEKKVVRMYFLDGMLLKDIGDKLSRSESWACGVLKSALKNFKELWQDSELELRQLVSR